MALTDLTIQIDDELKASGEALIFKLGISWSTAVNALLKQAIERGNINEPEPEGFEYSPELEAQDSYFTRTEQAELYRRIKDHETRGNASMIRFDPLRESVEDARARLNG